MFGKKFKNSARKLKAGERDWIRGDGRYTHNKPSPYLYLWSRLLQSTISQSATMLLTGKFHDTRCGIYKCEGGCNIPGVNELVLKKDRCYWDWGGRNQTAIKQLRKIADMISHIVLGWNPNNPVQSMLSLAVEFVNENSKHSTTTEQLDKAIRDAKGGGVFGGNALSSFFDHNPFGKFPIDRKYLRFCLTNFNEPNMTNAEVSQQFADEDLGESLLKEIKDAEREVGGGWSRMLCCSPTRSERGVNFWLNDGRYYGWHTEEQVREVIEKIRNGESLSETKVS